MNAIEELEKYIDDEGIIQISSGIFKDSTGRRLLVNEDPEDKELRYREFTIKANTTVAEYCKSMGSITSEMSMGYHGNEEPLSAEEYAKELLAFMTAPSELIVGECKKCFALMTQKQKDVHECDGLGAMTHEEWTKHFNNLKRSDNPLPRQVESVSPKADEIICRHLAKVGDTSGKLREVKDLDEVAELARDSGKRLKELLGRIDDPENYKFNDSRKKDLKL